MSLNVSPLQKAISVTYAKGLLDPTKYKSNQYLSLFDEAIIDDNEIKIGDVGKTLLQVDVKGMKGDTHSKSDITPFSFEYYGISTEGPSNTSGTTTGKKKVVTEIKDLRTRMDELKADPSLIQDQGTYSFSNVATTAVKHRGYIYRGGHNFGYNINDNLKYSLRASTTNIISSMLINVLRLKQEVFFNTIYSDVDYSNSYMAGGYKTYTFDEFSYYSKVVEYKTKDTSAKKLFDVTTMGELVAEAGNANRDLSNYIIFMTFEDIQNYKNTVAAGHCFPADMRNSSAITYDPETGAHICPIPDYLFKRDASKEIIRFAVDKDTIIFRYGVPSFYVEQFLNTNNGFFTNSFDSALAIDPIGNSSEPIAILRAGANGIEQTPGGKVDVFAGYLCGKPIAEGLIFFKTKN